MTEDAIAEIVLALKKSHKYRFLCEDTLERVARWAAAHHPRAKDAVKAAKRKLHEAYGAYLGALDWQELEARVNALPDDPPDEVLRDTCLSILRWQSSTEERLPIMGEVYAEIFRRTGPPRVLLDLACGLHPFAVPWMGIQSDVEYHAFDIDTRLISAVDAFFARLGVDHSVQCADMLVSVPEVPADVALLLKSLPCLERQQEGAGVEILRSLNARHVVVSFPTQSLGGREKGMYEHYREYALRLAAALGVEAEELQYASETFYVLTRG